MPTTTDYVMTVSKEGQSFEIIALESKTIKHQFDKKLSQLPRPTKDGIPVTYLIDLGRLVEYITIQGILLDEGPGNSHMDKKNLFRNMLKTQGTMQIKWDSNDPAQWSGGAVNSGSWVGYTVNVVKSEISEEAGTYGDYDDTKFIMITVQFVIGEHKG